MSAFRSYFVCMLLASCLCAPLNICTASASQNTTAADTPPAAEESGTVDDSWALAWENQSFYVPLVPDIYNEGGATPRALYTPACF